MPDAPPLRRRSPAIRIAVAFAVALSFALGIYALLEAARPDAGLISFSFLIVLPAAISAFIAYVADPWAERRLTAYLWVPVILVAIVVVASALFLHEGVICILMLSPLWLLSGLVGAWLTYRLRRRGPPDYGDTFNCVGLLALPLISIQVEPYIALPSDTAEVTRSIVVDATPDQLWPLLRGIPDVRRGEGAWNISQDVIGIPRPRGARLVGDGVGAERFADWGPDVRFRERITEWLPGRTISWAFHFDDVAGWRFTDRHLMPDSPYFKVTDGGYRVAPAGDGKTRVTLWTRYWIRTPVNFYSEAWGQLFLGDVEDNLLALIRQRAERHRPS